MSTPKPTAKPIKRRAAWGSLRKLPSGRWQARYPGPDGLTYSARTEANKSLTFLTKTDARVWLAAMQTKIARGEWQPPEKHAAQLRQEVEEEKARTMGFEDYTKIWLNKIRTEPSRSGKPRSVATVQQYAGKIKGYLIPEFGNTPLKEIDADRVRQMMTKLDKIPAPLNPKSKFNGISRPTTVVLMMILRQAARDGYIHKEPDVSIKKQTSVRHDANHDPDEDIITPEQVEQLYEATPKLWRIMVLLAAWCQLRRGECLGLQRRDIEWDEDGGAIIHVRRQLNAHIGDYSDVKSDAGRRSLTVPKLMIDRLRSHLSENVAREMKAPIVPTTKRGNVPLSNTRWGYQWSDVRDQVEGLPQRFRFHDLRHTGLTIFAQEGATLAELMRRGGHSDIEVVLRYQHATLSRDKTLADKMSDRVAQRLAAAQEAKEANDSDNDEHL